MVELFQSTIDEVFKLLDNLILEYSQEESLEICRLLTLATELDFCAAGVRRYLEKGYKGLVRDDKLTVAQALMQYGLLEQPEVASTDINEWLLFQGVEVLDDPLQLKRGVFEWYFPDELLEWGLTKLLKMSKLPEPIRLEMKVVYD